MRRKLEKQLTQQAYGEPPPAIPGVQVVDLARYVDESGAFTQVLRAANGKPMALGAALPVDFQVRQVNWSELDPGVIRAYHVHRTQTDLWFIPPHEKVLIVLADLREDPVTMLRQVFGDGRSQMLLIPPLVAHGYKNLRTGPARLLYFVDQYFEAAPEQCDEWRLPWDCFGAKVWSLANG